MSRVNDDLILIIDVQATIAHPAHLQASLWNSARWQYRSEKNAARQERRSERAEKTQAKRDSKRRPREKKKSAADSGRTESSAAASSLSTVPATSEERGENSNSTNASGQGDTNRILKPESLVRQEDTALPNQTIAAKEASGASDRSTRKSKEDRRKAKRANREQRRAKRKGSKATSPS